MARKNRSDKTPGEVLGIGHIETPINRESNVPPASAADGPRRQRRMNEGADGGGAAGVDMGAGGEGTDIE